MVEFLIISYFKENYAYFCIERKCIHIQLNLNLSSFVSDSDLSITWESFHCHILTL